MSGQNDFFAELICRAEPVEEPGDFRRGGLLYCGKCGAAKQCRIELEGVGLTVGCMCRCAEERLEARQKALRDQERALHIRELRVQGVQDRALRECTFEAARPEVNRENMEKCRRYVRRWRELREENVGLLLAGPPGTGKTYAAACIANALIDQGAPVLVTSFPKILNTGGWDKKELTDQMKAFDLLVLDDLGMERGGSGSGYALEIVQMVVDERYKTGKPLIVTTNLSKQEMDSPKGMEWSRIFDRLEEMCAPMHFGGPSLRKENAQRKRRLAREVFA